MSIKTASKYAFKHKPLASLDQSPPVQNTWYTVLDVVGGGELHNINVYQINDEADAKTVELRLTIDGVAHEIIESLDSDTIVSVGKGAWEEINEFQIVFRAAGLGEYTEDSGTPATFWWGGSTQVPGHNVKIEARITDAIGTNQHLKVKVAYDKLEAV